jgi:3,4-dihydroxy 2-butanone 4-phosphate synthase/GTP cyclohydrolase II
MTETPPATQTQIGLIMLSSSGGTTPRISRDVDAELSGTVPLDEVARAVKDIAEGRPVIVVDDADRENEGDIVFAASKATAELLAFTIRYGRGLICVPMLGSDLDRLNVPQMTSQNQERHGTAFTISVDARHDITTGISAADRATTIQLLASPASGPGDLVRPGHVFPLRYAEGGVLRRRGHTEAAVDLAVLAGRRSAWCAR